MRARLVSKKEKIELFIKKWDSFCMQVISKASKKKDFIMKNFIQEVSKIPDRVKKHIAY